MEPTGSWDSLMEPGWQGTHFSVLYLDWIWIEYIYKHRKEPWCVQETSVNVRQSHFIKF